MEKRNSISILFVYLSKRSARCSKANNEEDKNGEVIEVEEGNGFFMNYI